MRGAVITLALAIALGGCSSIELKEDGGSPVPASRVFMPAVAGAASAPGDGTILMLRDWGFLAGGCTHDVYLDGVKAFEIGVNERMEIHAPAGHHLLRVQDAVLICPGGTTSLETELQAGEHQVYRIQVSGNKQVNFARLR